MTIDIRLLDTADAEAFRDLRLRSLRDHPDVYHSTPEEWGDDIERYRNRIAANDVAGAFDEGRLVAFAVLAVGQARTGAKQRHKSEVWSVYTAPEMRGRGVGRRVMEFVISRARERGLEALVLSAVTSNAAAVGLYQRLGFETFGLEKGVIKLPGGRYVDEHLMELWL